MQFALISLDLPLAGVLLGFVLALGLLELAAFAADRRPGLGLAGLAGLTAIPIAAAPGLQTFGFGLAWGAAILVLRGPLGFDVHCPRLARWLPWLALATLLVAFAGLFEGAPEPLPWMLALQLVVVLPGAIAAFRNLQASRVGAAWSSLALGCHALPGLLAGAAVLAGGAWRDALPAFAPAAVASLLFLHLAIYREQDARRRLADVADHTRRELALQEARLCSEQAHFFAFVAHELRSPLGVLLTGLVNLRRALPDADTAARIGRLSHAAQRMSGLVDRHLQLQNLARSDFEPDLADEPPDLPLREALQAQAPLHPGRRLECVHLGQLPVAVPLDAGLVTLALSNLLDNAAKYAFADSPITVEVDAGGGALTYRVINHGPGLPPALAGRAFGVVPRSKAAGSEKGGFGIGLALAARVAGAHGGQLAASQDGARTILALSLPLAPEHGRGGR